MQYHHVFDLRVKDLINSCERKHFMVSLCLTAIVDVFLASRLISGMKCSFKNYRPSQ